MTIREAERKTFLSDPEMDSLHDALENALKYVEGLTLQWNITDEETFASFTLLIDHLLLLRN